MSFSFFFAVSSVSDDQGFIKMFWEWYFRYQFGKFLIDKLAIWESK